MIRIIAKRELSGNFFVESLKKDWLKTKPSSLLRVCNHTTTQSYNCGCFCGCETCSYIMKCVDCGSLLNKSNINHQSVTVIHI